MYPFTVSAALGTFSAWVCLCRSGPKAVAWADKGDTYARLAQQAAEGECLASSVAGEQPKFSTYAQTPDGPAYVLVKFSLPQANPVTQRWRDLLLAEHHALETLRTGGLNTAASWVHDHHGQRFLEVERFDRIGAQGRRGLVSLASLDAEFVGRAREPWPVLVNALVEHNVVHPETCCPWLSSPKTAEHWVMRCPRWTYTPAWATQCGKAYCPWPKGLCGGCAPTPVFSPEFAACISALEAQLIQATRSIGLLG